jgi:hypothetical protein
MSMTTASARLPAVIADIDAANAGDPRSDTSGPLPRPREVVYAERMTGWLWRLYPQASDALQIAARAQHICRWQIPRTGYPLGRDGYNAWRTACRAHHAALTADIMRRHGYEDAPIAHVSKIIRKEDLKRDPESQALENVVALVFAQYELEAFVSVHADYTDDKIAGILRKTLRKMDAAGHAALLSLPMPPHIKRVLDLAQA